MADVQTYDALVIGSGQGGGPLASALARAGRKTAIIERVHAGGTCINEGCTPTKTMVASARVAYLARRAADYGVQVNAPRVDLVRVRQRKRDIVQSFREGSEQSLASTPGLDVLMGEAQFTGPKAIAVQLNAGGSVNLTAETIIINAGARPSMPSLPGLDGIPILDSTSIMELDAVPEHLLILGGGYIALEFGQMFRRFGSQVTMVERGGQLLAREDADVAEEVLKILREDGIEVLLHTKTTGAARTGAGGVELRVSTPEGDRTLTGSHLLVATGRTPNTERLRPAASGVATDARGFIPVDERLATNVAGIYAIGDINGGPAFTHISYDHYRILQANLLEGGHATTTGRPVPYTIFIDPQLGRVGLSENEARAQGRRYRLAKMPMSSVARALEVDESRGFMKALVDAESDQILGCAVLGLEGGEIMSMIELAMMGKLPYTALHDAIFAHPTLAESLNNLFASLEPEATASGASQQ